MGNIGPSRQRYDVLPVPAFGVDDADLWTVDTWMTVPSPQPMPVPQPEPTPEPNPLPDPDQPPSPPSGEQRADDGSRESWLARTARALK